MHFRFLSGWQRPLLLAIAISFFIVACNGNEPEPTPTTAPVAEVDDDPVAEQPVEEPTEEPEVEETAVPTEEPTAEPEPTDPPEPTAVPAPAYEPEFESASCEFETPEGRDVTCGYLIVPENRSQPEKTIRLHVAIFASESSSSAPDPVVYLDGGPGGDALETVPFTFEDNFGPLLADRDVIIFDQRGTGYSEPSLACPEVIEADLDIIDEVLPVDEEIDIALAASEACFDRLTADGVNLTAYNSVENAADVNDLRIALGYDEWNLYGISYGTKLAMTTMRDHPEGIRSVVLDSPYPLPVSLTEDFPENAARAFDVFFAGCAADAACNEVYPDLETVFYNLTAVLNEEPALVSASNFFTGDEYEVAVDGSVLMSVLFQGLYSSEIIPILPQMITDAGAGDTQLLGLLLSNNLTNQAFFSIGMYSSVQCHEEIGFDTLADVEAEIAQYPQIADLLEGPEYDFLLCDLWDSGTADSLENEAVSSDIPTLIQAGEYDPITPPSWGVLAAETLSNSYFFEYPGVGHGASISGECPQAMTMAFLNDPTSEPDSGCISGMGGPEFSVPTALTADDFNLVPFTTDLGIAVVSGVTPEGWEEQFPGVFLRGENGLDQTAVLQQGAPGIPADSFLELFTSQLGLDSDAEAVGEYVDGNGRNWTLYKSTLQGLPIDLGLVSTDEATFVVLLIANNENEQPALYDGVFLPALDAISAGG